MRMLRCNSIAGVFLLTGAVACFGAVAQTYPTQAIKFIVPFTPGTGMDTIARTVGPKLADRLGQPVVVENKPGASGNIGAEGVARAAPDGHTVLVTGNPLVIAASLYPSVPFHPLDDFAPISLSAWGALMLAANPKTKFKTVRELIAQAKAQPGKINYGSPGVGTPHHMAMELFKDRTGIDLVHIPYKGSAGATADLLSGQISVMFVPVHVAVPYVAGGRLRGLALSSPKRHPSAPDLATLQELGIKNAEVELWYGFLAPKGTPAPIIATLNAEIGAILGQSDVKQSFDRQGLTAASSKPEALATLMKREYARWAEIIKKNHITAE